MKSKIGKIMKVIGIWFLGVAFKYVKSKNDVKEIQDDFKRITK